MRNFSILLLLLSISLFSCCIATKLPPLSYLKQTPYTHILFVYLLKEWLIQSITRRRTAAVCPIETCANPSEPCGLETTPDGSYKYTEYHWNIQIHTQFTLITVCAITHTVVMILFLVLVLSVKQFDNSKSSLVDVCLGTCTTIQLYVLPLHHSH